MRVLVLSFLAGLLFALALHMLDNRDTLASPFQILPKPPEADVPDTENIIHPPASEH